MRVAAFVIVTTSDLPEAYHLATFLESRGQRLALVNIVARPLSNQLHVLARLRRNRGTRYVADLMLARAMNALHRRRGQHGAGAFPEVDARLVSHIRARHSHLDCGDPHASDVLGFVGNFAPDYVLLAGCPILQPSFYGLARRAALNRHLGVLPDFRGSDCAIWAFALQQPERAGYSIHVVSERVDAGDVVLCRPVPVQDDPCLGDYIRRVARAGSDGFVEVLDRLIGGAPLIAESQEWRGRYFPPAPWSTRRRAEQNYARLYQHAREASRAPSERLRSFAHTTPGSTAA